MVLLAVIGGFFVLCLGVGVVAVVSSSGDEPPGTGSDTGTDSGARAVTVGQAVRDGKFEFTVTTVRCAVSRVGNEPLDKSAQGQFCLITTSVKNIGKEPRTLDSSNQKGYDATGAEYSSDGVAGMYANNNNEAFLNEINPGNQVTAVFVFDIPKDRKLARVELHDSPFSSGVQVTLG